MKPDVGNELYIEIVFFINDVFLTCIQMRHRCYVFQKQKLKFKFLFNVGCYGETGPSTHFSILTYRNGDVGPSVVI